MRGPQLWLCRQPDTLASTAQIPRHLEHGELLCCIAQLRLELSQGDTAGTRRSDRNMGYNDLHQLSLSLGSAWRRHRPLTGYLEHYPLKLVVLPLCVGNTYFVFRIVPFGEIQHDRSGLPPHNLST